LQGDAIDKAKRLRTVLAAWSVFPGHQPRPAKVKRLMAFFHSTVPTATKIMAYIAYICPHMHCQADFLIDLKLHVNNICSGGVMKENKPSRTPEFSQKLKKLRKNKDWSQGQIAMKIGVDPQRISKYERGILYPTTEIAIKLADLFEVSLDYLFRDDDSVILGEVTNKDLIKRLKAINALPKEKQKTLIELLDAFIKQHKFEELMQNN
jgi:transcriptional regulator with XRE-family HTH domain